MPTFCRHNRFIERCPICSMTLPGSEPAPATPRRPRAGSASTPRRAGEPGRRARGGGLRVRHEGRASEDGYSSGLVPGLHASADAERLAAEIAFASARLASLALDPPGAYGRALDAGAGGDIERATWAGFLIAYISPAEDEQPFAAIDAALAAAPYPGEVSDELGEMLDRTQLGPRSSHAVGSGTRTLRAYTHWLARVGDVDGAQEAAFTGDPGWAPARRFAHLFERLALPGLTRSARYELLVTLGRLGLYELSGDSLHLSTARSGGGEDATTLAAKRVFGIGDPLLIDRRAAALAEAASVPFEALDLALWNWGAAERATLGFRPTQDCDDATALAALGL
jgi:hypothetical protein